MRQMSISNYTKKITKSTSSASSKNNVNSKTTKRNVQMPSYPKVEQNNNMGYHPQHNGNGCVLPPKNEDMLLVPDGNGNMVDPSFITRKYLGVTYHRRNKKWIAQASENGRSKYLGCFDTPEKAAKMYDSYVVAQGGDSVKTNFPVNQVDPNMKPLVKRYRKRSRDVIENIQQSLNAPDAWETYIQNNAVGNPLMAAGVGGLAGLPNMMQPNGYMGPQTGMIKEESILTNDNNNTIQPNPKRRKTEHRNVKNAYQWYVENNKSDLEKEIDENPLEEGNTPSSISRELSRRWKNLSKSEKRVYNNLAREDEILFKKEKEEIDLKEEETGNGNLYKVQQQYNEYLQLQSQWMSMVGYNPQQISEVSQYYSQQMMQQQPQMYNYLQQLQQQQQNSEYTDEQSGYSPEELQALQQMYYNAQLQQQQQQQNAAANGGYSQETAQALQQQQQSIQQQTLQQQSIHNYNAQMQQQNLNMFGQMQNPIESSENNIPNIPDVSGNPY